MKPFEISVKDAGTGRALSTIVYADDKTSAKLLAKIMFNVTNEESKLIREPKEVDFNT